MIFYLSSIIELSNDFSRVDKFENLFDFEKSNVLLSFAKYKKGDEKYVEKCKRILIDSGAFTFLNSKKEASKFKPMDYVKKYGEFIKKNEIDDFIELDIESVFGVETYIDCLHYLQDITGKEPLRVWHLNRGFSYYSELVKKFPRICIGGIATKEINISDKKLIHSLLNEAHKNNCKVHGLGVGSSTYIREYDFDSVDSATWLTSMRNGKIHYFNGHEVNFISYGSNDDGSRLARRFSGIMAMKEWFKYSQYVDSF